ncbi:hypothetical protein D9757_007568 [Collybiopsis confluens]|uniref:BZIP domain-containing protein n=1 Tax=Collybiopsis confluens TaxID=2823264 RepID=A0A8H5HFA5_9AGAR|nr:hypothetical protein D9757_007568 [Collybiopsis confluens]
MASRIYGQPHELTIPVQTGYLNVSPPTRAVGLAAHYGIPQSLPKPPKPNLRPEYTAAQNYSTPTAPISDFEALRQSYLTMLSSTPEDPTPSVEPATNLPSGDALQPFYNESLPQFQIAQNFGEYLTSPLDTPYDDFTNTSPLDDSPWIPDLNTPIMDQIDDFEYLADPTSAWDESAPLFDEAGLPYYKQSSIHDGVEVKESQQSSQSDAAELLSNHKLYLFSPSSPVLEDFNSHPVPSIHSPAQRTGRALYSSPRLPTSPIFQPSAAAAATTTERTRSKSRGPSLNATGTRKDITPESMVPYNAPTQSRSYVLPSSTSRKAYPAHAARKRSRSEAFGDNTQEQDELTSEAAPGPNASEVEHIEWKRRQNTLAARKSRKRKLEHLRIVECERDELKQDRDKWKVRCGVLEGVLKATGTPVPKWDDD